MFQTLFLESSGKKCIPLFVGQENNDNITRSQRIHRFNSNTGQIEHFEALQPNATALCTVDHSDVLEGKVLNVAVDEVNF